jgi:hypothetical protein
MREVVPEQLADPEVAKPMIVAVDDAPFRSVSDFFCDAAASLTRPPSVVVSRNDAPFAEYTASVVNGQPKRRRAI